MGSVAREKLWKGVVERSEAALVSGALQPIETSSEIISDCGVSFVVRVVGSLARKDEVRRALSQSRGAGGDRPNPFLPYDEELYVGDISETHICLLNKFNVIDSHLLIVTRDFEDQDELLKLADFEALWASMGDDEAPTLGFYNGGEAAGASQRHKHLQLVPLPLASEISGLPIEPSLDNLPFVHDLVRLDGHTTPQMLLHHYRQSMATLELADCEDARNTRHQSPYNLLLTRSWMMIVPRSAEFYEGISVNAIGFAGGLLVRSVDQLELIRRIGPMTVLEKVGRPLG